MIIDSSRFINYDMTGNYICYKLLVRVKIYWKKPCGSTLKYSAIPSYPRKKNRKFKGT